MSWLLSHNSAQEAAVLNFSIVHCFCAIIPGMVMEGKFCFFVFSGKKSGVRGSCKRSKLLESLSEGIHFLAVTSI